MTYLQKMCLTQTLYMSILFHERDVKTLLEELLPLYACREREERELSKILGNEVFSLLDSSLAVFIHQNYIDSFCPDENAFGKKEIEQEALEIKKNVYINIERLQDSGFSKTFMEGLAEHYLERDELCISYAVALFLSGGNPDVYLPLLRRAETKGRVEAGIILMALDSSQNKNSYLTKLSKNKMIILQKDILEQVESFYSLK